MPQRGGDADVPGQAQDADDQVPERGHDVGPGAGTGGGGVLAEGDVTDPMELVLNLPVAANPLGELVRASLGVDPQQRVAVLFSHQDFPGARFDHRFPGYDPALERIELKEEIETGALHRISQSHPAPDDAGIIWTTWEDPDQD